MRKKKTAAITQESFSQEAQKYAIEALESLVELGRNAEKETTRLYAWKTILERGLGPSTQLEKLIMPPQAPTLMLIPYQDKKYLIDDGKENKN